MTTAAVQDTTTTATTETKPAVTETKPAVTETITEKPATQTVATETKPTGTVVTETQPTTGGKADASTTTSKAPENYALTIPAGGYVDADVVTQVETLARKNNLSNEDAQAILNEHAATVEAQASAWRAVTEADTDYGGTKLAETQKQARAAIDLIRPAGHPRRNAFLAFMNRGGAGNHIEVVSFLADLGKRGAEDAPGRTAGDGTATPKTAEEIMYGGTAKT